MTYSLLDLETGNLIDSFDTLEKARTVAESYFTEGLSIGVIVVDEDGKIVFMHG